MVSSSIVEVGSSVDVVSTSVLVSASVTSSVVVVDTVVVVASVVLVTRQHFSAAIVIHFIKSFNAPGRNQAETISEDYWRALHNRSQVRFDGHRQISGVEGEIVRIL